MCKNEKHLTQPSTIIMKHIPQQLEHPSCESCCMMFDKALGLPDPLTHTEDLQALLLHRKCVFRGGPNTGRVSTFGCDCGITPLTIQRLIDGSLESELVI